MSTPEDALDYLIVGQGHKNSVIIYYYQSFKFLF